MALAGKDATIKESGTPTAMVNEACTELTPTTFQITDAARRILDPAQTEVVRVNTVVQPTTAYSIDHFFGIITFVGSETGNTIDISTDFLPVFTVAETRVVTLTAGRDMEDDTVHGDQAHTTKPLQQNCSANIDGLDVGMTDLDPGGGTIKNMELLRAGTPKLLEVGYGGAATTGWRMWVLFESGAIGTPHDGLVSGAFAMVNDKQEGAAECWGYGTL